METFGISSISIISPLYVISGYCDIAIHFFLELLSLKSLQGLRVDMLRLTPILPPHHAMNVWLGSTGRKVGREAQSTAISDSIMLQSPHVMIASEGFDQFSMPV